MDPAYANAIARRKALDEEIRTLRERLNEASAELSRVDNFLRDYAEFAGIEPPPEVQEALHDASEKAKPKRARPVNLPKEKIGDYVEEFLNEFGRPLSRDRLFSMLEERGVHIQGTDPKMVFSTMLWRMPKRFVRIQGKGYWFADRPEPGERTLDLG